MSLFLPWWLTAHVSFISCPLTTMEQVAPQACAVSIHERFWKPSSEQSGVILELVWLWSKHFWKSVPDWVAIPWPHEKLNTWFRWDPDTREATCCSFKTVRTVSSQVPLISQHQFSPWLHVPKLGMRRQQCVTIYQKMPGATRAHLLGVAEPQWLLYDRPWKGSSPRRAVEENQEIMISYLSLLQGVESCFTPEW